MANKVWWGAESGSENSWGVAANWFPAGVPAAGEDVQIPAGSAAITGSDTSAVTLGAVRIDRGYTGAIGSYTAGEPTWLTLDCAKFEFAGTGTSYIKFDNAASSPIDGTITTTAAPSVSGVYGLYLCGSSWSNLTFSGGYTAVSCFDSDASNTIVTARAATGAVVKLGRLVTAQNIDNAGTMEKHGAQQIVSLVQRNGVLRTVGTAAITTLELKGGIWIHENTGTVTTVTQRGGTWDQRAGQTAGRDVSTFNYYAGAVLRDENVTIGATNLKAADFVAT